MKIRSLFLILVAITMSACTRVSPPKLYIPAQEPKVQASSQLHPRVILVLGGGGARGFAHAGVIKVLEKNHIPINMIVGTSAGSIVGALYADGAKIDPLMTLLKKTNRQNVIDFSILDLSYGPISGLRLQNFLVDNMQAKNFSELKIPLVTVATDLRAGGIHAFSSGPVAPAVNASSALSPFFRPVKLYGNIYVDGGFIDPVPVDVALRYHPQIVIAVSLNPPLNKLMPVYTTGTFIRSLDLMLKQLNEQTARRAQIIIRPKLPEGDVFDGSSRDQSFKAGEEAANLALPAIRKLMRAKAIAFEA
jgi:NTE family protein